jgi:two-component system sporulation sensor kinase B
LDRGAFHQCLGNLLCNAADAIPSGRGGTITVGVALAEGQARFSVSDDGVGMSPDTLAHALGGMYSTKGSKGTGLGLLVVQKIVAEHMGTLTVDSEAGRGTTWHVAIPIRQAAGTLGRALV